ncbi:MAG: ABC transporter substrate-binding protein [Treponema sp.]|nr:ABC transporter substrate-binding protein [Treponema sp.]
MKKIVAGVLAVVAAATLMSCGGKKAAADGKVFNVYVWNDEFPSRFKDYFEAKGKVPAGITVNFVQTPNADNAYQNKLDEVLLAQEKAKADDKVDMFLVEADYALKYVDTPYTLDVKKDIGLTDADLSKQYKYTKDIMTDSKGVLKGVSWQACPGGFIYRRSYAIDVLGTDDPVKVGEALSNWDKFDDVAAKAKAKGYYMLSGFDDAFRVFSDNAKTPWVNGNKIVIDPMIERWIKMTKEYTDKGYNNKANLWSAESTQGMLADGGVFGYFGPAWFIDFCMPHDEGSAFGDWAFCKGPQGFSWGGTWMCGAAGTDNIALIKDVMYMLSCDSDNMTDLAKGAGDFANNEVAMTAVANSDYGNPFLKGQNHMSFFLDSAKSIDKSCMSMYDQGMNEKIQSAMADYYNGLVTLDQAWDNFYTSILEVYPNLTK